MKHLKRLILVFTILTLNYTAWSIGGNPPNANFNISPSNVVLPGTNVCYTDASTVGLGDEDITNWDWTFTYPGQPAHNVTDVAYSEPPCMVYNTAGTYTTCVTATNADGNDTQCYDVTVAPPYEVDNENGNTLNGVCGYYISDAGGQFANYGNGENYTVTICSGSTDFMQFNFSLVDLGAGDMIEIFNGPTTASPILSTITSANNGTSPNIYGGETCITIRFISDGSGVGQGFLAQMNCHNNLIISAQDGKVLNGVCGSRIYDSGFNGNYDNNENYTMTVCADAANQVPQIRFTGWGLAAGDQVNFYDGSSTSGQVIYTGVTSDAANFLLEGLTVTGQSQCMTVEFISNSSGVGSGFNGIISCPVPPAGCNGNLPASDNMNNATLICDFSEWCGTTSSFYGVDMDFMGQTSVFDGSIENNSWLSFVADASTATFNLVTNCANSGDAIQVGIYAIDANENVTWLSPASINGGIDYTDIDGFTGSGTINAQGMTAGETYYIMIDGQGGDVCDYELTAGIGVQLPDAQASPDISMTCGDPESVSVVDLNGSTNVDWTWTYTGTSSGGPFSGSSVDVSGLPAGTYTFTVEADDFSQCSATPIEDQVTVIVTCPLPVELINFDVDCEENVNIISWETVSEQNNDYFDLEKSFDGSYFRSLAIVDGAGTTNHKHNYKIQDFEKNNGTVYYRIRQVDMDGTEDYSDIISSNDCYTSGVNVFKMYFNQLTSEIIIDYEVTRTTNAYVAMSDLVGRSYLSQNIILEPNNNQIRIQANDLAGNTMYILNVSSDNTSDTERIYVNH